MGTPRRRDPSGDEKPDGRLLIDDSKRVHDGANGLRKLEQGVLSVLASNVLESSQSLEHFLKQILIGNSWDDLGEEEWFEPAQPIPLRSNPDELTRMAARLTEAFLSQKVTLGPVYSLLVPAPRFNALLDEHHLKSVILAEGVIAFCRKAQHLPGGDPLIFAVDKLGGRNFYGPMLQQAFPDGWVHALREGGGVPVSDTGTGAANRSLF